MFILALPPGVFAKIFAGVLDSLTIIPQWFVHASKARRKNVRFPTGIPQNKRVNQAKKSKINIPGPFAGPPGAFFTIFIQMRKRKTLAGER